jgi:hypothetical protein
MNAPVVLPIVCFLAAAGTLWLPKRFRALGFVAAFGVGNSLATEVPTEYSTLAGCHTGAAAYEAVVGAGKFLTTADPALTKTRIWFDEVDSTSTREGCEIRISYVGYALAGMGVPYLVNPFPMPPAARLPADAFRQTASQKLTVAVLSSSPDALSEFNQNALASDVETTSIESRRFSVHDATFEITLLRLQPSQDLARRIALLPGGVVKDWTGDELEAQLEIYTYATPAQPVIRRSAAELLFVPATIQDHLALPFIGIPPRPEPRALLIAAASDHIQQGNCRVFVQDQRFQLLGEVACGEPSSTMQNTVIRLQRDVTSIRLYFQSPDLKPMVLPWRLRLAEHHGAAAK